ncbi:mCG145966, partial [Mus musculus]
GKNDTCSSNLVSKSEENRIIIKTTKERLSLTGQNVELCSSSTMPAWMLPCSCLDDNGLNLSRTVEYDICRIYNDLLIFFTESQFRLESSNLHVF